ncbi:uncharacterized protein LOC109721557 [Ananas comosus]|uniref:Uncharacterized protein LOC109721557 n=1 Tax=Ananas comosus TaxID=4615 RepID=A0A6P5GAG5_ANACO|nr:uncharacterized protein LOC109721557 [Ananas comosus]
MLAQEGVERLAPPVVIPNATKGVAAAAIPFAVVAAGSGTSNPEGAAMEAARERALAALVIFTKFNPPMFDEKKVELWMVESWIDSMETLFEDIYTLEKDKVHLATHCLEKAAKVWWKRVKRDRPSNLLPMVWKEFRGLVFTNYFPDSEKKKLQDKFRKLRQGDRSVGKYEQEFFHIIDCVPDVVRDDKDMAGWFLRGLRPKIYEAVQILKLTTFAEVLDRALWAEYGSAYARGSASLWKRKGIKGRSELRVVPGIG